MKAKTVIFILLAVLLAIGVTPVYAEDAPALPHAFYGKVDVNGSPAPVGTSVEVRGEGVQTGSGNNPIETTVAGEYGSSDPLEPKLVVQGSVAEGATVTFYVNGFSTGQTAEWHSGEVTEIDLAATIEEGAVPEEPTDSTPPEAPPETTPPQAPASTPPESIEPAPPESAEPAPEAAPGEASPAPLLPPPPPSSGPGDWPLLWWVIGGVVLLGLIIISVVASRRAY